MKPRYQLYIDRDVSEQLEALATKPGSSKSGLASDALRAYFKQEGERALDERFAPRLDRLSRQLSGLDRDTKIIAESLALFVHMYLTTNAPLASDDAAGRAIGRARFDAFITELGRRLATGRSSFPSPERQA